MKTIPKLKEAYNGSEINPPKETNVSEEDQELIAEEIFSMRKDYAQRLAILCTQIAKETTNKEERQEGINKHLERNIELTRKLLEYHNLILSR